MTSITAFDGEYRWLSNFWPCNLPPMYDIVPRTVEHAYQASKTDSLDYAMQILSQPRAGAAKRLGKGATLRPGWELMKLDVMKQLIVYKFDDHNPELQQRLLATGDAELIEGNTWGDTFWGCTNHGNGIWFGDNHLGKILMVVRMTLRNNKEPSCEPK